MNSSIISAAWADRDAESLVWLASYPRSGNTFTRLLLANYFASQGGAYDINKLADLIPADTSEELWRSFSDHIPPPSLETWEQNWRARPGFLSHYRKRLDPWAFPGIKTHTVNLKVLGQTGFDIRKNDRAIYIVRHPLDVLLSFADFNSLTIDTALEMLTTTGMSILGDQHGGAIEIRGSWKEHVSSWVQTPPPCPLLLIRYEDLHSRTSQVVTEILTFLDAPVYPDRVNHAVDASRFEKVRKQEASNSFTEAPDTMKSGVFFRSGEALQWLRELSQEQAYRLADACDPIMSKLGYAHPREVFFDGRNALQPINLRA